MAIDQISRLSSINQLLNLTGTNSTTTGGSSDTSFSTMLENMIKSKINSGSTVNNVGTTDDSNKSDSKAVNGLDSLSIQPQKLIQMLQMQAFQSMLSSSKSSEIGSIDGDDDSSDRSALSTSTDGNDMSQLIETMLQNQDNSTSTSNDSLITNLFSQMEAK